MIRALRFFVRLCRAASRAGTTTEVSAVTDSGFWGDDWGAGEDLGGGSGTTVVNWAAKSRLEMFVVGRLCCSLDGDVGFRATWFGTVVAVGVITGRGCCETEGSGFCDCCRLDILVGFGRGWDC